MIYGKLTPFLLFFPFHPSLMDSSRAGILAHHFTPFGWEEPTDDHTYKNSENWCERLGQSPQNPEQEQCLGEAYSTSPFNHGLSRAHGRDRPSELQWSLHSPPAQFHTHLSTHTSWTDAKYTPQLMSPPSCLPIKGLSRKPSAPLPHHPQPPLLSLSPPHPPTARDALRRDASSQGKRETPVSPTWLTE